MLLLCGGTNDPNIQRLADQCVKRVIPSFILSVDRDPPRSIHWDPSQCDFLEIDGHNIKPSAIFLRWNAFDAQGTQDNLDYTQANEWFDLIKGWALAHPHIRMLNRSHNEALINKPAMLALAKQCGLNIPTTRITNNIENIHDTENWIQKPVTGGSCTKTLEPDASIQPYPHIIQEKLNYPELRLFRIGKEWFAFRVNSPDLDYRISKDVTIEPVQPPDDIVPGMEKLIANLKMDYAAADFKTCPKTGKFKFLEINSMPMFPGYDDMCGRALSDALITFFSRGHTDLTD